MGSEAVENSSLAEELSGRATGVFFLTAFGAVWVFGNSSSLPDTILAVVWVVGGVICLLLVACGVYLRRISRLVKSETRGTINRDLRRRFNRVFIAEGVGIGVVVLICANLGYSEWIPAAVALVVGLHFFPLARLFRMPLYYFTGIALCVVSIATMIVASILDYSEAVWFAVPGLGSGLVLWTTGAMLVVAGLEMSRSNRQPVR